MGQGACFESVSPKFNPRDPLTCGSRKPTPESSDLYTTAHVAEFFKRKMSNADELKRISSTNLGRKTQMIDKGSSNILGPLETKAGELSS